MRKKIYIVFEYLPPSRESEAGDTFGCNHLAKKDRNSTDNPIFGRIRPSTTKYISNLALKLRFLATGEAFKSLQYASGIPQSTNSEIIPEVCAAIYTGIRGTDDDFSAGENLMKPHSGKYLSGLGRIFNYWLSRALWIIENALGIMSARFRDLQASIRVDENWTRQITCACCVLHNYLIAMKIKTLKTLPSKILRIIQETSCGKTKQSFDVPWLDQTKSHCL